ncbi:hypothetical protein [Crocosphaera sp.]|uniref:hypothetical protein n=1 Tax=Crocosphaera sp. TaxID=2729996 RepID=UPI0026031498|nr:hypothetical protein [Crocosphaera sp.]MDJ0580980.1 hypothetical protein [Crocosphaera sp.]
MLALLSWYIIRLVVLMLLILGSVFHTTIVLAQENSAQPVKSSETTETVVPSSKTESKKSILQTKKETSIKTPKQKSKVTYPNPPHRYNMKAIEKFDEELYGN